MCWCTLYDSLDTSSLYPTQSMGPQREQVVLNNTNASTINTSNDAAHTLLLGFDFCNFSFPFQTLIIS